MGGDAKVAVRIGTAVRGRPSEGLAVRNVGTGLRSERVRRLLPGLLLAAYGVAFALRAFGGGVPAFDDHPGQLFRLWHALDRSFPDSRWTADWNPDWWGGYPELQFYPPGFALIGAVIRLLSLWQLPVEAVYQILCGFILLLPAVTTFILLARLLGDGWLALPPAFLALTLSAGLRGGVEESMRWGMLTSRLPLGVLPLLLLALKPWLDGGRLPVWAPVLAGAVILGHPSGGPAMAALLTGATLLALAVRPRRQTLADMSAVLVLGLAFSAFWVVPFVARPGWVVPLAWGEADLGRLLGDQARRPVVAALASCAVLAWGVVLARRRPFVALVAALPLLLLGGVVADAALFRRGWSPVEPARLTDSLVFATLWAAGLGMGSLVARLTARRSSGPARPAAALAGVALLAVAAGGTRGEATLTLWPWDRARLWPHLDEVSGARDLPRLWDALRGTDRVLFLTSSLRLDDDPAWYAPHSHALSLAPRFAGREIVHGTYTHPSPLAARFYTGATALPPRLGFLAEQLDGQRLLGQPLGRLSSEAFETFARPLRIATVVVPSADAGRVPFLDERYSPSRTVAGFTLFERRERPWPQVERITHRRYRVLVPPSGGVWVKTGVAAYPLWQAKSGRGRLETRADAWGLLEFRVPLDVFEAELVYGEGALEWVAVVLTGLGLVAWPVWAWRGRRPAPAGSGRSAAERRRRTAVPR
jgi:hypothetical protein